MSLMDSLKKILADEEAKQAEPSEQVVEEAKQAEPTEEIVEEAKQVEPTDEVVEVIKDAEPIEQVVDSAIVEELKKQNEALQQQLAELNAKNAEIEAKARIDDACSKGWLTPAMLEEADGVPSVFVDLAKEHPDLFDRLQLVMAPKILQKEPITDVSIGEVETEEDLVKAIKTIAANKGISYAEAAKIFRG